MLFFKGPAGVTPPGGPVVRPTGVRQLDYEGELALVVGADRTVLGWAVANDVSARDYRDPTLLSQKAGDTFCPWGPWVTTADEIPDPYDLRLRTWVNDELRQDATTAELIFRADEILAAIGRTIQLVPGDLVLTGTPAGVGITMDPPRVLEPGDRVRIEIDGLGAIEHEIVAEGRS
jgi:acylpyruvate hydrolase